MRPTGERALSTEGAPQVAENYQEKREAQAKAWADRIINLLDESNPSSKGEQREERRAKQRHILERAYLNNICERVNEHIGKRRKKQKSPLSPREEKVARGMTFEELALAALPREEHQYPELEEFILGALRNPQLWVAEFFGDTSSLTKEEKELYEKYLKVKPREDELRALRNSDSISVMVKKDMKTGKPVALITGLVEAKNHDVRKEDRAIRQAMEAPQILVRVIERFKEVFPLLVRYLGLSGELPEDLDIVDAASLSYTIIQPSDVRPPSRRIRRKRFPNCEFRRIPFSKKEASIVASVITSETQA